MGQIYIFFLDCCGAYKNEIYARKRTHAKGREVPKKKRLHLLLRPHKQGKVLCGIQMSFENFWEGENWKVKKMPRVTAADCCLWLRSFFFLALRCCVICFLLFFVVPLFFIVLRLSMSFLFQIYLHLKLRTYSNRVQNFRIFAFLCFVWKIVSICTLLFCIIKRKRLCLSGFFVNC